MYGSWKNNNLFLFVFYMIILSLISSIISDHGLSGMPLTGQITEPPGQRNTQVIDDLAPITSPLFADNDNTILNATLIDDATFFNKTKTDNLSGYSASGDDLFDYYKIYLDNHAETDGLNADKLLLWLNTTVTFNLTMSLYDPALHLLALAVSAAEFENGSISISAQSTGYHYIKIWFEPFSPYAEYNLTYQLPQETNILLDHNNDFSNGTDMQLTITDMGTWEKKEYFQAFSLNQHKDIHDFFNLTINVSENVTITMSPPDGNIYGIELFNQTNSSSLVTSARFVGNVNNTPLYYESNKTAVYFLRVYTFYEFPNLNGGSGTYSLSIRIKPQNQPPVIRPGAFTHLYLQEDTAPKVVLLNDSIYFDPDVGNTNDNLTFYIKNGSDWDHSYSSDNISVTILPNGTASIWPQKNINTTGENITFVAFDWLGWNITHNITVVVTPQNDPPWLTSVNDITISGGNKYLNLTNDHNGYFGAFEDEPYIISITGFDIEGDSLEFSYNSAVNFKTSVVPTDPNAVNYSFTPTQTLVGIVQINVSVNETENESIPGDWIIVNITVNNTNDPPAMETVNGGSVVPGEIVEFVDVNGVFVGNTINFTITAIDMDLPHGDKLTFNTTNLTFIQRNILKFTRTGLNSTNVSFSPSALDAGIKFINITVHDEEQVVSNIILKVEVREAEKKYSLSDDDCTFEYHDGEAEDDYTFYELVYRRPNSPISYHMMAFTAKGNTPGVDIVQLSSTKVGDYMNVSVDLRGNIADNTTVKVCFVRPFEHYETKLDNRSTVLPEPYAPEHSKVILFFSYGDPDHTDIGRPIKTSAKTLEFSIHLGILENTYGITHGFEFGLFGQAYKNGLDDYAYFAYDSIGLGAVATPQGTVSHLLSEKECDMEEVDDDTDDVYGYNIKFNEQDRSAGLTVEKTSRGGLPEIDIIRVKSNRRDLYLDVTLSLAGPVSNDTQVSYYVYIVTSGHVESGLHLTPDKVTGASYPKPYIPLKGYYYQVGRYSSGQTVMADRVVTDNNKLTFSFHLGLLQHPELGNVTPTSNFGIFATAVRESNTTSILEYGYFYDSVGLGAQNAPTMIIEETEDEKDEELPIYYILGQIGGIPILFLVIIAIILICIIVGYASYVKGKYKAESSVEVPPVPPVPSSRSSSAPNYGVYPGLVRDERYYDSLFADEYEPEHGYDDYDQYDYGPGPSPGPDPGLDAVVGEGFSDDTVPEDETYLDEEAALDMVGAEEREVPAPELEPEGPTEEELTSDELDLLVTPEDLITDDIEAELGEIRLPDEEELDEEMPIEEEVFEEDVDVDEEEVELEYEEPVEDEDEPIDDDEEPVDLVDEEPVEDEDEPIDDEEEPVDLEDEEPVEDEDEPVDDEEGPVEDDEGPIEEDEE